MLKGAEFSDFTFVVQGKKFKVHRVILGLASPVMRKLFNAHMENNSLQTCDVDELEPDTFENMLRFIYDGTIPENFGVIARKLYEAANFYQIEPLMRICLSTINNQLCPGNALELFEWADQLDLRELQIKSWGLVKR